MTKLNVIYLFKKKRQFYKFKVIVANEPYTN